MQKRHIIVAFKKFICYFLCQTHSRLSWILPLFKCVHTLIKIPQGRDAFVCNFVDYVRNSTCSTIIMMPNSRMKSMLSKPLLMPWYHTTFELIFDPGGGEDVECFIFSFVGHNHLVYHTLKLIKFYSGLLWKSQQ
jgi:hypothetical protein